MSADQTLLKTPLYDLHVEHGGKMVPFAGYSMPVQYPLGIMKEHLHTRDAAGLFDVSHMGQAYIRSTDGSDPAAAIEKIMPGALQVLKPGKMRYTLLLNDEGGIEDDLMVTRTFEPEGTLYVVVNAAFKEKDYTILEEKLGDQIVLEPLEDRALIALQGPKAESVLAKLAPEVADLSFMEATMVTLEGVVCWVSRSGYTGEDGYEISVPSDEADAFAKRLLKDEDVELIGLGARDSLRLEAGLCLSGHDFDGSITPVGASVTFALGKKRREAGDFVGSERILSELSNGADNVRVGILPEGRAPAREGTVIADVDGNEIGKVTSGGFGPTLGAPVAMGYVPTAFAENGTEIYLLVRGKSLAAKVAGTPFVPQRYKRKTV
ncbi:glycine cleavage system aminomethyltransferase GcvT [Kordiimonas sp. SCSIO 12610]|uniref:glycine cleavage system aminomethyltransferase GcvT n=1 Tax=Kordiimonas sp. SCSIO 12610 TaxID=2829597 RepID=UPI00210B8623|nr:glycine cleavage system aminomethyltransferase GcvT [Kordiimonas sp. SCSIO 12610]UTW54894.1 glycine cleavage system aminomethyltransferase GcvT [Kordiimonas sp. SCSIO 12610]